MNTQQSHTNHIMHNVFNICSKHTYLNYRGQESKTCNLQFTFLTHLWPWNSQGHRTHYLLQKVVLRQWTNETNCGIQNFFFLLYICKVKNFANRVIQLNLSSVLNLASCPKRTTLSIKWMIHLHLYLILLSVTVPQKVSCWHISKKYDL